MIENSVENSQQDKSDQLKNNNTGDMFFHNVQSHLKKEEQQNKKQKDVRQVIQSLGFQIFITVLALYSLFSDDIRVAAFDSTADLAFDIIHIMLIAIFLVQITLSWYSLPGYKLSFYFFLDLISSFSLLLDISMLTELMYSSNDSSYNLSQLAAQSRASRVATRAVRIVKLVRIIRIIKMYKAASQAAEIKQQRKRKKMEENLKKQQNRNEYQGDKTQKLDRKSQKIIKNDNHEMTDNTFLPKKEVQLKEFSDQKNIKKQKEEDFLLDADIIEEMNSKQSKISKVLSDLTIKKIIIVVLLIMFLVPLFDSDNYIQSSQSWDYTVVNVKKLLEDPKFSIENINAFINQTLANRGQSNQQNYIIYFSTPFNQLPLQINERHEIQRSQDITTSIEEVNMDLVMAIRPQLTVNQNLEQLYANKIYAVMNYHAKSQKDASKYSIILSVFSVAKTVFVCIVLIGMLHFFTEDINELIVHPTELMMNHVMEIAKNPESASTRQIDSSQYETALVHNAILKIGALLSLVFGSAGAQIIGSNIMKQGDMNPMIGGKKKCAIFGFCDIRNFAQITEVLQEDIMLFVNKIGQLVHSSVFRYGGSANKNIGEAFLLVWQLPDNSYQINNKTNQITWKKQDHVSLMCDYSVYSFVKAIVKIHKDPTVLDYKHDQRLTNSFGNNFQVKMGFGIHIGWAIEGAIGSEYKIDASYLSPNVNMASRLEAATKQYEVNLLISENIYDLLTPGLKNFCRNIDRVTVKGSAKPIKLYTVDLNLDCITPPVDKKKKYSMGNQGLDVQIKREVNMKYFEQNKRQSYNAEEFIMEKKQLRQVMVGAMSEQFYKRFQMGLQCYLKGKWADSRLHLNQAIKIGKNDGPTKNILNYMKKFDFVAPQTWKNYRPLTSK